MKFLSGSDNRGKEEKQCRHKQTPIDVRNTLFSLVFLLAADLFVYSRCWCIVAAVTATVAEKKWRCHPMRNYRCVILPAALEFYACVFRPPPHLRPYIHVLLLCISSLKQSKGNDISIWPSHRYHNMKATHTFHNQQISRIHARKFTGLLNCSIVESYFCLGCVS